MSIAVTAQAFGLVQNLADAYTGTFLFSLPPSKTEQFVSKVMIAYRNAAAQHRSKIDSGPAVYREIQGYLRLCTPVTIEAMLTEHIADATAEGIFGAGSTEVVLGSRTTAAQKAIQDGTSPLVDPKTRLPKVVERPTLGTPGAINSVEANVPVDTLRQLQQMVCAQQTGIWNDETRKAISRVFQGADQPRPNLETVGLTRFDMPFLQRGLRPKALKCGNDKVNDRGVKYDTPEKLGQILQ